MTVMVFTNNWTPTLQNKTQPAQSKTNPTVFSFTLTPTPSSSTSTSPLPLPPLMAAAMTSAPFTPPPQPLKRRNSMTSPFLPKHLHFPDLQQSSSFPNSLSHDSSFPTVDLELISLDSLSYTSLKDLMPSSTAVNSPTGVSNQSICEIPIRNHLVKQAAWAYLQPMAASPGSSSRFSFRRAWGRFSAYVGSPVNSCFGFVLPMIMRVFDRFLGVDGVRIGGSGEM